MKKPDFLLIGIILTFFIIGCSPQEAIHTTLDDASDDAQVIMRGQTGDKTYRVPYIDSMSRSLLIIDLALHELNKGDSYISSDVTDLGGTANKTFLLVTPNTTKWVHLLYVVEHELEITVSFYEGATITSNGTTISSYNRNRNSIKTAKLAVHHTPGVANDGTLIRSQQLGNGKMAGGASRGINEFILKPNSNYLLRVTNETNNNNVTSSEFHWYEHTSEVP